MAKSIRNSIPILVNKEDRLRSLLDMTDARLVRSVVWLMMHGRCVVMTFKLSIN